MDTNPLRYLFSRMWRFSEGNRKKLVLCWVMFVVAQIIGLTLRPLVMAKIINTIQAEGITENNLAFLLKMLLIPFGISVAFWSIHGPARLMERANAFRMRVNYRKYLLKGVMTLPLEWHAEHHSGDTIDKVEKGTSGLYEFSAESFEVIYSIVQIVVCFGMLVYFSPVAAGVAFGVVAATLWMLTRFDRVLIKQYRELNYAGNKVVESVFDAISNITTVIVLRVERVVFEAIVRKVEKPFALERQSNRLNELKWFLLNMCSNVMVALVIGIYFYQHVRTAEGLIVGNAYMLFQYLEGLREVFVDFASRYSSVMRRKAYVMNAEDLSQDFREENFTNHVLPADWKKLEIGGLNFSYHAGGESLHLDNVSLTLTRGELIAFVGESGGGKSTLLNVMRGLYKPQNLNLSVDGRSIPQGFDGISRAIALVQQDPEIFATTVGENITVGAEYDAETVERFTDMACFTEVAKGLPNGLNSSIKEKGVNLSGGQKQRLALARGLLACHDKDIVLLDESTSSLDTTNETRIYRNIFEGFPDKTIVSSIHRLHLLPLFDRIYFFSKGRIAASGSLDELLLSCPEFEASWTKYHNRQE